MTKKFRLLGFLFAMAMVVGCGGGNSSKASSSSSSSNPVSPSQSTNPIINSSSSSTNPYDDYETPTYNSYSYESLAANEERDFLSLAGETWKFYRGVMANGEKSTLDDNRWESVTIPHTWNKTDGQDGGGNYYRGEAWYHHRVILGKDFIQDKYQYIEFLGVNMQAKVYVNDKLVGSHKGGYTGFRFNITENLHIGENFIAVWVSNVKTQDIAPLGGDFNNYGGIYREVNLFSVPAVHVDMMDYGSSGLKLTTTDVSAESAKLKIESNIVNDSAKAENIKVKATFKVPSEFEEIPQIPEPEFDIASLTTGEVIEVIEEEVSVTANGTYEFEKDLLVENPKLWNGKKSPFRYQVILDIIQNNEVIDQVSSYVGFRTFEVTKEGGSFLNGVSYPLRGVSRHQEWKNMGNAISKQHHEVDFGMMYEMGVNSIRLAHYPQSNYMYELCDRYGIAVWAEIPFVNEIGTDKNFVKVTQNMLIELIRQQYNRASIVVWGLQNEVAASYNTSMIKVMHVLNKTAHEEDPTRLTTQATNSVTAKYWESDLLAWNTYPGWYSGTTISANMDDYFANYRMPVGISEYGYGGNINQHADFPTRGNSDVFPEGQWHPQEYQNQQHELAVRQVTDPERNDVWCAYIWNMFDFASDSRYEGSQPGMNDKGLVTYDRSTKKDTFYLYKANWNKTDKFVHLTSKSYTNRNAANTYVKAYSNCDTLALYVNNELIGTLENDGNGIFKWDILLPTGDINIRVEVLDEGLTNLQDSASWKRTTSNKISVKSSTLAIDNTNRAIMFNNGMVVSDLLAQLTSEYNCSFKVVDASNKEVTGGLVTEDMKVIVTSENGNTSQTYKLAKAFLSTNKQVTVSSNEGANLGSNAVDGDQNTRWAASNGSYPQHLIVDLGGVFTLDTIDISWYVSGTRSYKYNIYVGDANGEYQLAINRTSNTTSGKVSDNLNGLTGRYIKVEVVGVSDGSGYASIYELVVTGWGINSDVYKVSGNNILVSTTASEIPVNEFLKNLKCEGDYELTLHNTGDVVRNGDTLTITDGSGKTYTYAVVFN